ncbi:MAG: V-type ATP synthase subunit D [Clostridia bacterium]
MAIKNTNPTRMELTRLKKRLKTARRGHKLLKDKRDELMKQFLEVVRKNKSLREQVEDGLKKMYGSFVFASAQIGGKAVSEALMAPKTYGVLSVSSTNKMSVNVPVFDYEIKAASQTGAGIGYAGNDIYPYGFAYTSSDLDMAVEESTALLPTMIRLAEVEKTADMLADEIEKTRRRVNALEYIMIPEFEAKIKEITLKLEENERGNLTRLMKIKDMMLESARNSK